MASQQPKKPKTEKKIIGTHSGTFHCDEALACYMLLQTDEFAGSEIIRSRDPKVLATCDVLVDVGAVYDPPTYRFDHHQIEFQGSLNEMYTTRLSSAGLIYKHFGHQVISKLVEANKDKIGLIYNKVYQNFIQAIDAIDNGIDQYDTTQPARYVIRTDLGSRVAALNPVWNDPNPQPDERFKEAVALTGKEFRDSVLYFANVWLPARVIVENAVQKRFEVDPSGEIILLETFCPWKDHLNDIETETNLQPQIIYVLFAENANSWRIQCVAAKYGSFENRLSLPWKGLRDEELGNASGIPGGVFVHANGFIGGNKTKEGVLAMARKALQLRSK